MARSPAWLPGLNGKWLAEQHVSVILYMSALLQVYQHSSGIVCRVVMARMAENKRVALDALGHNRLGHELCR